MALRYRPTFALSLGLLMAAVSLSIVGCASNVAAPAVTAVAPDGGAGQPTPNARPAEAPPVNASPEATPSAGSAPTKVAPARAAGNEPGAARPLVLAYYVPYDATSWQSLQRHADALDYVSAQWVSVDACGNIGSTDDRTLVAFAGERGITVLPSLLTSSGWLNKRLLTDPATSGNFLDQIVSYVVEEGYKGFDLDLEGINAEDRDAFTSFVSKLAARLHERGKLLTLAIPAKTADVRTGWAGPYDYAALGRHADLILLMTYDYSWPSSPPGSIAPQKWVDQVATYAAGQMPPEKVLIGAAFYGYDWNVTQGGRARALRYPQAVALARQYGAEIAQDPVTRSATFKYTARAGDAQPQLPIAPPVEHEISARKRASCGVKDPPQLTSTPQPTPARVQERVVWLEDANSLAGRLEIAKRHGLGGVGAWRLGQEDPEVWSHLGVDG